MTDLAEAFISHLLDNKYVGPGVPSTVGITEKNVRNIFNMVRLRLMMTQNVIFNHIRCSSHSTPGCRGTWETSPPPSWSVS